MCLNHPETIPRPSSVEQLSSEKLVPSAEMAGDCWCGGCDVNATSDHVCDVSTTFGTSFPLSEPYFLHL